MKDEILLGDVVKERITGFEGVVESIAIWNHGCIRAGIRKRSLGKDGIPLKPEWFDILDLKKIKNRKIIKAVPVGKINAKLGDMATDNITGFKGEIVCIETNIYGEILIEIQPTRMIDGKPIQIREFHLSQLTIEEKPKLKNEKNKKIDMVQDSF